MQRIAPATLSEATQVTVINMSDAIFIQRNENDSRLPVPYNIYVISETVALFLQVNQKDSSGLDLIDCRP